MFERLPIVGVMGSHDAEWTELSSPLGEALAALGVHILTGGGKGVMTAVSRAFVGVSSRSGCSIGIIPTDPQEDGTFKAREGYPNPCIEIPIFTPLGAKRNPGTEDITRNHVNIMTSDVVIALPGGSGTLNEIGLAIKFGKPVCLLGPHDLPEEEALNRLPRFTEVDGVITWTKRKLLEKNAS